MTAALIDGTAVAARLRSEIAAEAEKMKSETGRVPGLAAVLVGDNPASQTYVRSKRKACAEVGIDSFGYELPKTAAQEEVDNLVAELNADPNVHGILVQLPLPDHLNSEQALSKIGIDKDVDGFHPINIGRLSMKGREPLFVPCTPAGCIYLLEQAGAQFKGARAVVLGRSNIVGLPVAMLLLHRDCTLTICHSRTKDLPAVCREADILIAAVGRPQMVKGDWVKPGAFVIDVGINRVDDATKKSGYRLVGDVDFDEVKEVAGALTPVPGGVGPMTIAMLLRNTLRSATAHSA
ncbi:MAG: bifunctional methylenetetrahydrofolate dehydrogenase/methenyltetrahydrofolate cyclohydrolase FolD [Chloroflexi bacterium]|nr:bifunctional methylenetetrahydrofolate dehydrogenase/methenyltetrahydrofolate cyclohydrolase FolD [Chloroflexota bacterium]MBI3761938.1 bifunctional methylenetetrahydrofolate dehydrogenase/methenyltetrahydrofolate cyclohydrolase FolD [Chloroflexota bacterium]